MVGDNLDLSSTPQPDGDSNRPNGRQFLGINFACCGVYTRIYVNRDESAYEGNCPKCQRRVKFAIGPGGSDSRFFTAY